MRKFTLRKKEALLYLVLASVCAGLYQFSFQLQENFYREPNEWYELEKTLGFQTSLTSLFTALGAMLVVSAAVTALSDEYVGSEFVEERQLVKFIFSQLVLEMLGALFMTFMSLKHDLEQEVVQPYPDNNALDVGMALLALIQAFRRLGGQVGVGG